MRCTLTHCLADRRWSYQRPVMWQATDSVGHLTHKIVFAMTYDLSSETLNITTLVLYHTVSHFVCSHILNIHAESWKNRVILLNFINNLHIDFRVLLVLWQLFHKVTQHSTVFAGSLMIILLQIYNWISQWKSFEMGRYIWRSNGQQCTVSSVTVDDVDDGCVAVKWRRCLTTVYCVSSVTVDDVDDGCVAVKWPRCLTRVCTSLKWHQTVDTSHFCLHTTVSTCLLRGSGIMINNGIYATCLSTNVPI